MNEAAPLPESAVVAEKLTKRYGSLTAVEDLSFSVAPGEIVGFLGPNGAGKSTTMRILSGTMSGTSGRASIWGVSSPSTPLWPNDTWPTCRRTTLCPKTCASRSI